MRKTALILALLISCLSLFACADKTESTAPADTTATQETEKELVTRVENEDGGYTLYDYDDMGNCIKVSIYSADDQLTSYNETTYDENGVWISKIYYDAEGNVIREITAD